MMQSMKVRQGVHVEWVDDEAVILDPENERLHYLNPTAALLYALMAEVGFTAALEEMRQRFSTVTDLDQELERLVEEMVEEGLLEDE